MPKNAPYFSVVMPVYGVELYLKNAIESVLNQTFSDFEIILVDDCSPDNSGAICEEYAKKYDFISVVHHKVNKGLSAARNTGFSKVCGQYVWFMDSDDCVENNLLQTVYDSLQKNPADAVVFGCIEDYYNKQGELIKSIELKPKGKLYSSKEELRPRILDLELNTFYGYAWNKFYSTEHIRKNNLQYDNVVLIEDIKFNIEFFQNINALNILETAPYHYAKRGTNSLTAKFVPEYYKVHRERIRLLYEQHKNWGIVNDEVKRTLANIYTRYIFSALSRNCDKRANMSHEQRKDWIKAVFADELFNSLMPYSKAESKLLSVMCAFLKRKSTFCSLALGRIIFIVQNNLKSVFIKSKQERK